MAANTFVSQNLTAILGLVAGLAAVVIGIFFSKYLVRFLLLVGIVALGVFAYTYDFTKAGELDPNLPAAFRDNLPHWFFGLGTAALLATYHLISTLIRPESDAAGKAAFPDIAAAWEEILIQLGQARIDPAAQDLYLILAPDEARVASIVNAAGIQFFARAPASVEAPIHGHAAGDALFLSCSGASSFGGRDGDGPARLEYLCRLIAAINPERPTLRGIAVVFPFEWAVGDGAQAKLEPTPEADPAAGAAPVAVGAGGDSLRKVAALRDDLEVIRRTTRLRCPTLTVCCLGETVSGLKVFAERLPAKLRQQRCGFSVPLARGAEGAVFRTGMAWMTRWFQVWSLSLIFEKMAERDEAARLRSIDGNGRLVKLNVALREGRDPLARFLEAALTVHRQSEPVLYRGCYFVATGSTADQNAFSGGLFNGARKGRLLADRELTTWSREADRLDRGYRRWAWGIGLATAGLALPVWLDAIVGLLGPHGLGWIGWLGPVALAATWAVGLLTFSKAREAKPGAADAPPPALEPAKDRSRVTS